MENGKTFPNLLILRKENHLSQEAAAKLARVSVRTYRTYEKGLAPIPSDVLMQLADFYKVSCDFILGRVPDYRTAGNEYIGKATGLTDPAILQLKDFAQYHPGVSMAINDFLSFDQLRPGSGTLNLAALYLAELFGLTQKEPDIDRATAGLVRMLQTMQRELYPVEMVNNLEHPVVQRTIPRTEKALAEKMERQEAPTGTLRENAQRLIAQMLAPVDPEPGNDKRE